VYVVAGNVRNLQPGIYHYRPREHELVRVATGDKRRELGRAALDQEQVRDAPAVIAFSAVFERTTRKYRERGRRYVHIEVGHASQNVLLQAVSLGLGAVPVGAFSDEEVKKIMNLPNEEEPMYLMPTGRR
jgi:SagB-type dehydrogenase family enzyme